MVTESRSRSGTDRRPGHRPDLTGLRALAVVPLLLAGAGVGGLPGGFVGVDIFFVVSGFLVTGSLVDEWNRAGRISLLACYARRVRRALPAAMLVLAAALVLAPLFLPRDRWAETGWDVLAGGLHVLNWRLAEQGAEAYAPDGSASLLTHYWALGVAGQLLLLWPVLFAGVATWAVRRRGQGVRAPLLITVGLLAIGSFAWSVARTGGEPEQAFLGTGTRLWELALGAALALLGPPLARLSRRFGRILGWAGVGAVLVAVLALRPGPEFPGYLALLPALGTAAIIAGGGPTGLLASRPLQTIGAHAHPLYLWYWPLLVATQARFGDAHPVTGLAVLGCAALLAALTHRYVETPIRTGLVYWSPAQVVRVGALLAAAGVTAGLLFQLTVWPPAGAATPTTTAASAAPAKATPAAATAPGAAALGGSPRNSRAGVPVDRVRSIIPKPADAAQDLPDVYRHDCFPTAASGLARACVYGDRESTFTVALAGDSHAASWVPALQAIAVAKRWRLVTYLNPGCPFLDLTVATRDGRTITACGEWYDNVRAELTGPERPDLLLTTNSLHLPGRNGRMLVGTEAHQALVNGMRRTWSGLTGARVSTVVLRDVPVLSADSATCVSANPKRLTRCTTTRRTALASGAGTAQAEAVDEIDKVTMIDLNSAICPAERCAPVIGGVLVYRDSQHLTATYARTLTPRLRAALDRVAASAR